MRLHRVLAATLAAFFVVGCSSEKSTSPKALASTGPKEKPSVEPSREAVDPAPPPKADPPPATATASPPAQHKDPAKDTDTDKPPAPRDPWAGIDAERKFYCKQFAELLEPIVNRGVAARALKQLSQGDSKGLPEGGQRVFTVLRLGQYKVPLNRERETMLRTLLASVKDTETGAEQYLAAVDSLLPGKAHVLAAAYKRVIDQGTDVPAATQRKLAEWIRAREEAFARGPQNAKGVLSHETESLRTKLLEQSVKGDDLFKLALLIHGLGQAVIEKRELCRTFHDLVMALPEPHRSEVLMQLAWSLDQEALHDLKWERLKGNTMPLGDCTTPRKLVRGFDLRLMSPLNDVRSIPTEGKKLVLVAPVNNVLHFRIFDADGQVVVDTDETRLATQARPIADFKRSFDFLRRQKLTRSYKDRVIFSNVAPIVGHTHARFKEQLEAIAADRRGKFLALEQARRDTIEGWFRNLDAPGWQALVGLDVLFAELQAVLDVSLPALSYRLRPLIPADAPRDAASNVLSTIPLPGSVEDRVPTIRISEYQIVIDAPAPR